MVSNATTYLVRFHGLFLVPFQYSSPLLLVEEFVQGVVNLVKEYQWVADGLTLAGRMLPGLGFAILLRYLPVKRNLHYLAMGFGLTAMLTVLYSYVTGLGGAVAGILVLFLLMLLKRLALLTTSKVCL